MKVSQALTKDRKIEGLSHKVYWTNEELKRLPV